MRLRRREACTPADRRSTGVLEPARERMLDSAHSLNGRSNIARSRADPREEAPQPCPTPCADRSRVAPTRAGADARGEPDAARAGVPAPRRPRLGERAFLRGRVGVRRPGRRPGASRAISARSAWATEGVLLVRDERGRLNAFSNTCRHRVTSCSSPATRSDLRAIKCPYHAWVYGLDGIAERRTPVRRRARLRQARLPADRRARRRVARLGVRERVRRRARRSTSTSATSTSWSRRGRSAGCSWRRRTTT